MNGVKVALGNIEMTVEAARQCAKDKDTIKISPRAYPWQNRGPSVGQVILSTNLRYCPWRFVRIDFHTLWKFSVAPIMIRVPLVKHNEPPNAENHHL